MTRNLKALGLALLAICAMGAVVAQTASAASQEHEFHAEQEKVITTGKNLGKEKFQVGAAGTVECETSEFESTQVGTLVSAGTYKADTITVVPRYSKCTFGGQPATVNFNHCAYVFDSDTGETEPEPEVKTTHANVEIECAHKPKEKESDPTEATKIEIHTAVCTITVGAQLVKHAVRYENDTASSIKIKSTAKNIVTGKVRNTAAQPVNGCLTFPSGAIGTYTGESTVECFKDNTAEPPTGTDATTPQGKTTENGTAGCTISEGKKE